MGKGGKLGSKRNTKKGPSLKDQFLDESDEDYNAGSDEDFDESDDCSFNGDESDLSLGGFLEDEEDIRVRKFSKKKEKSVIKPKMKRKRINYTEEDCEDDDDDEEFQPEEIDFDDDEEEDELNKNKNSLKLREKGFAKRKKSANHKSTKKQLRKKSGKPPNVSGQKQRRLAPHSDSDFVSSGSSDHEYTISEEEREQVREASKVCTSLTTNLRRPTLKRLHDKDHDDDAQCQHHQVPRQQTKGKEKIAIGKRVCGICLTEEGKKTVRGTLDCCDHYFCFACIMEWSKVESRCPLCKQRFGTIVKPTRSSACFDFRTVVINVPERDQVYQPSEEELRGYLDPYENVICTECHLGGDDSLMLLCDVCDSPAHTFCVGLGHEVPEGNWYCEGCRPTTPQTQNPDSVQRASDNLSGIDLNISYVPETPLTQETGSAFGSGANTVFERRRIRRSFPNFLDNVDSSTPRSSAGPRLFGYQLDGEIARQQRMGNGSPASLDINIPFVQNNIDVFSSRVMTYSNGRMQNNSNSDASPALFVCREGTATPRSSQGAVQAPF
jgi:hypothetical protein